MMKSRLIWGAEFIVIGPNGYESVVGPEVHFSENQKAAIGLGLERLVEEEVLDGSELQNENTLTVTKNN